MTTRKEPEPPASTGGKRGRPRVWKDEAEKQRGHRAARRERARLVDELLHAVRNAYWEEPERQRRIHEGDDAAVLQALITYYQDRHWLLRQRRSQAPSGREK